MNMLNFIDQLKQKLDERDNETPAINALLGYPRSSAAEARKMHPPVKESAVLMSLFLRNGVWHTVFMLRPDGASIHSNQISFPGGKMEKDENAMQAALREANEEIGVKENQLKIIGKLSELYIPPSHFVVQPFIGIIDPEPVFTPNQKEVHSLIEFPISSFLRHSIVLEKEIFIPTFNRTIRAKYFDVNGMTLWGATAMMIQEFRTLFAFET